MKLKILAVHGNGDYTKEHVMLQAVDDCDVGHYMLADTTFNSNGRITNKVRHTYWFPNKQIKKGDYVSVWTKPGTDEEGQHNGKAIHRFYWGLKQAVWNDQGDCALLIHTPEWQVFAVKGEK